MKFYFFLKKKKLKNKLLEKEMINEIINNLFF